MVTKELPFFFQFFVSILLIFLKKLFLIFFI
jgi:hypothetical protein